MPSEALPNQAANQPRDGAWLIFGIAMVMHTDAQSGQIVAHLVQ